MSPNLLHSCNSPGHSMHSMKLPGLSEVRALAMFCLIVARCSRPLHLRIHCSVSATTRAHDSQRDSTKDAKRCRLKAA
nr:hypothetical protein CFP56_73148 [Quercus suber]